MNNWDLLCSLNLRNWSDRYSNWSFAEAAGIDPRFFQWLVVGELQLPAETVTLFLHEVFIGTLCFPSFVITSVFKGFADLADLDEIGSQPVCTRTHSVRIVYKNYFGA